MARATAAAPSGPARAPGEREVRAAADDVGESPETPAGGHRSAAERALPAFMVRSATAA
jgi:hypothetical protein